MSKLKFFQISTALLLVLNLAFLLFGFMNKPRPQNQMAKSIVEQLKLDKQQEQSFNDFRRKHQEGITKIDAELKNSISQVFEKLPNDLRNDPTYENIANSICELEKDKINLTYSHFVDLNSILNEEQKKSFKPVVTNALKRLLLKNNKGPRPPKDF